MIWIADQASADHFQISKIDNKLDDLEKVKESKFLLDKFKVFTIYENIEIR